MRRYDLTAMSLAAAIAVAFPAGYAGADRSPTSFAAKLSGFQEVGPLPGPTAAETGAILSGATGTLRLDFNGTTSIDYTLTYTSGFSSAVTQSHIHFGKRHVPGGIIIFLCSNLGNGPAGTPACPPAPGKVTGTLTAAGVVGPTAQNIPIGNFPGLLAAITSHTAYANIHTVNFPAGEIRGQIEPNEGREHRY
jgi:hypothetical protein